MTAVLVVAEHDASGLAAATAKTLSAAHEIGAERVDIVVAGGDDARHAADAAARLEGVDGVLALELGAPHARLAAALAPGIAELGAEYTHVLAPSTTFGKDLMPRVAALLDAGQLSDIMAVRGTHRFDRPIYAGNAIVTVDASPARTLVATVRIASFAAAASREAPVSITTIGPRTAPPAHTRYVGLETDAGGSRPDLTAAARVVAGGRGVGTPERFALVEQLADRLGAALGASRAAVDAGLAPNDLQIGQTGKVVAPELYIALGISGAIQHLTGIKDAGTIVAINSDIEAPIFGVADIGLVADLDEALPALLEAL